MRIMGLVALVAVMAISAPGRGLADEIIGHAKIVMGDVAVLRDGNEAPLEGGAALYREDVVVTGDDGSVGLSFKDNSRLSLGANSRLTFRDFKFEPSENSLSFISELAHGTMQYISGVIAKLAPGAVSVVTPVATIAVRGTRFLVRVPKTDG